MQNDLKAARVLEIHRTAGPDDVPVLQAVGSYTIEEAFRRGREQGRANTRNALQGLGINLDEI